MTTIDKIRQLYEQNPNAKEDFIGTGYDPNYSFTLEEALKLIETSPPTDLSFSTLDSYKENLKLSIVLAHIPAKEILSNFGDDVLFWTCLRYPYKRQYDILLKDIETITKRDSVLLEKAKLTAWQLLRESGTELIKKTYDLGDSIRLRIADSIDLKKLLQENAKEDAQLSEKRLADYSLHPLTTIENYSHGPEAKWGGRRIGNDKRYSIYLDTPYGLALTYKGEPNAVVGFFPNAIDSIIIYQLQGVRPDKLDQKEEQIGKSSSRGLMPIDWQKLMVDVVENIAKQLGYSKIAIQSGINNSWTKPYYVDKKIQIPLEEAVKKYDYVAKRLGFYQAKDKNWYKNLNAKQKELQNVGFLTTVFYYLHSNIIRFRTNKFD